MIEFTISFHTHPATDSFCIEIGAKMAPPTMLMADAGVVVGKAMLFVVTVLNAVVVDEVPFVLL